MEYVIQGASIECNGANIVSRDIPNKATWHNEPKIGRCKLYKCMDNSEATIIKELNPKQAIIDDKSLLDKNDKIRGSAITVIVDAKSDLKYTVSSKSGRHKAQYASTKGFTYAKLTLQCPNLKIIKDTKQLEALKPKLKKK